MEEQVCFN